MNAGTHFYFDVQQPQKLSRLLIFIKWILILPHTVILSVLGFVASLAAFAAWWVILFTGVYPPGMWQFVFFYQQWSARVSVYSSLLRDEYPPIGEGPWPLEFSMQRPERSSRGLVIGRIFLAIPLGLWMSVLYLMFIVLIIVAWVSILVNENIPAGVFERMVGVLRYTTRVNCYLYMLTDIWPGFHLDNPAA